MDLHPTSTMPEMSRTVKEPTQEEVVGTSRNGREARERGQKWETSLGIVDLRTVRMILRLGGM